MAFGQGHTNTAGAKQNVSPQRRDGQVESKGVEKPYPLSGERPNVNGARTWHEKFSVKVLYLGGKQFCEPNVGNPSHRDRE
jgi:hypothetical protein